VIRQLARGVVPKAVPGIPWYLFDVLASKIPPVVIGRAGMKALSHADDPRRRLCHPLGCGNRRENLSQNSEKLSQKMVNGADK
jgi:hypothetical protein